MEALVLNGKTYVKASKAARDLGYTSDYVGQLCRGKHVDAHLVGRTWYVNQDELSSHRVEKKRMSRVKAREQAHKIIEAHRQLHTQKSENGYKNIAIRYEEDHADLIPSLRKLSVETTTPTQRVKKTDEQAIDEAYTVENEGKKISFSGKLKIVDASDDAPDDVTVIMSPQIEKHSTRRQKMHSDFFRKELTHLEETAVEDPGMDTEQATYIQPVESSIQSEVVQQQKKRTGFSMKIPLTVLFLLTSASVCIESTWSFTVKEYTTGYSFNTTYKPDIKNTKSVIAQKI